MELLPLPDGTIANSRPIRPSDSAALQRFHAHLSEASIRLRFFHVLPVLSDAMAHDLTDLDGHHQFALIALDPGNESEIIAVVRYMGEANATKAEYAAVVADRWQGRGLGLALTERLIEVARAHGIATLTAEVLPENSRMLGLLHELHLREHARYAAGVETVTIHINEPCDERSTSLKTGMDVAGFL